MDIGSIGNWARWEPNFLGNHDAGPEDRVSMEIRVLTHDQHKHYRIMQQKASTDTQREDVEEEIIRENVRNIVNLKSGDVEIINGTDLLKYAPPVFTLEIKSRILSGVPVTEDDVKN